MGSLVHAFLGGKVISLALGTVYYKLIYFKINNLSLFQQALGTGRFILEIF